MAKRRIVDPHHHLWNLEAGYNYPWLQDLPLGEGVLGPIGPIARSYLLEDLLADTADYALEKSVHIEAVPADPVRETQWIQALSDSRGMPSASVGFAALNAPDVEAVLEAHAARPCVRGIRHILNWHKNPGLTFTDRSDLMTDEAWLAGFGLLDKYGFSFDLQIYPSQFADAVRLAERFPETLIILNHTGMPVDRDEAALECWRDGIVALADCDNVVAKISGLGMVDWKWSTKTVRPFVLHVIESFGTDRTMFASNFPVDKLYSSFTTLYQAFEAIVADFSDGEQDRLFRLNAVKHYRL
ncbi:MAG: amidohydrolase family protein [Bauldia sp.]|nr:amidohydrolase family protein [Bauldia sp.]